jgi:hypothetical protein
MPLLVTMRVPSSIGAIECAAEGLSALNYRLMHTARVGGGGFPALYESGIVYRREPIGSEQWQCATELLRTREGDCEDLAAYRAAELRMDGEPATVAIVLTRRGTYHAVVRHGDGTIEDPSKILLAIEAAGYTLKGPR